jgi:hypothetical protein
VTNEKYPAHSSNTPYDVPVAQDSNWINKVPPYHLLCGLGSIVTEADT